MNKLTIIPQDKTIYIDGRAIYGFDLSFIDSEIHALQWIENNGWIERKGQPDEPIENLPDWAQSCVNLWEQAKELMDKPYIPSDEEKIENNILLAKSLLSECDWTQLPDVHLGNANEWIAYRVALRAIVNAPEPNSMFPTKPLEQWII